MKIAIAGFGLEGKANYEYFAKQDYTEEIVIFDENPATETPRGVKSVVGEGAFSKIPDDFTVVRTNGLAPRKIKSKAKIWTSTNEFFLRCPAKIIGVTGSKGKGTTASFITEILRAGGYKVHLLGNIGVPPLRVLPKIKPDDIVVFELSSFQLWDAVYSPDISVITNIEPDHLDVHKNFSEYIEAKSNIFRYQKSNALAVFNQSDRRIKKLMKKMPAGFRKPFPSLRFAHIKAGAFYYGGRKICSTSVVKLPGEHNLLNALAAINASYDLVKGKKTAISKGLANFTGLPHRLKFVAEVNDVAYYDDSIATTPGSAIAAIKSFKQPKVIILGGTDKGGDYRELAKLIAKRSSKVRAVVTIGENRQKIIDALKKVAYEEIIEVTEKDMKKIVATAQAAAQPKDVVIMSPAAASFGMFRSYQDRGEQFIKAATALKK